MKKQRMLRAVAGVAVATLVLTGCRGGGDDAEGAGPGITAEPCPDAVNEDNGCIYLGAISDLTKGPFAPLAGPITDAQKAFWQRVNEDGGVGGYDVNISDNIADSEYNPEIHNRKYQEMRKDILALGQTLGSSQTLAILDDMKSDDVIGVPASWNSAWDFEDQILQSGANYCFEAMNGIDWAVGKGIKGKVLAIHYGNDYGGDAAAGVEEAAKANGLDFVGLETPAGQDNQAGAVAAVLKEKPAIVYITTGPAEMATIVGGAAAQGWQGQVLGSSPTWNPALLESAAAPAIEAMYAQVGPWGPWGTDTPGHEAMREALGDVTPSDGYGAGWTWSYPLLAALEAAAEMDGGITRENLVKAAGELTEVDYEGILPPEAGNAKGDPAEVAWRQSVISTVDKEAPTGVSIAQELTAGPTATAYDYSQPCFALQ